MYTRLNVWCAQKQSEKIYSFERGKKSQEPGIDRINIYINYDCRIPHVQISMRIHHFDTYCEVIRLGMRHSTDTKNKNKYYFDSNYTSFEKRSAVGLLFNDKKVSMAVQEAGLSSFENCSDLKSSGEFIEATLNLLANVDESVLEILEYMKNTVFNTVSLIKPNVGKM